MGVGEQVAYQGVCEGDLWVDICSGFPGATQQLWAAKARATIHILFLTWLCPPNQGSKAVKSVPVRDSRAIAWEKTHSLLAPWNMP